MGLVLVTHIVSGSLGILTGFVALYASKGAPLHRRIGMVFVVVMLAMTSTGTVVAAVRNAAPLMNIPAAIITAYLVVTGLTTVRTPARGALGIDLAGAVVAFLVGLCCLSLAFNGDARGSLPAFPFYLFGSIGVLGAVGDLRRLRAGGLRGSPRIARHLWRMSLALFVAAMSFFIGQSDEFPKAWRIMPLLATPPLTVLVTMIYWLLRVRRPWARSPRARSESGAPTHGARAT